MAGGNTMSQVGSGASTLGGAASMLGPAGAGLTSTGVGTAVGIPLMLGRAAASMFGGQQAQAKQAQANADQQALQAAQQGQMEANAPNEAALNLMQANAAPAMFDPIKPSGALSKL